MAISFEQFIIQCCKSEEGKLRKWFRRILPRYGFTIKEDDYISSRAKNNPSYRGVHNLLAVRGTPKVCLVAHTDVCRDHGRSNKTVYYGDPETQPDNTKMVKPVIKKKLFDLGNQQVQRRIIQDETCDTQVGGDDRLGVAINTWIALNTGYDLALLFTTDEEIGLVSAEACTFPELKEYELCVEVDRGNHSHELVNRIGSTQLCEYETTSRLLEIAWNIGQPRKVVQGMGTDVAALKRKGAINNSVNMTCGYHLSQSDSGNEFICIQEACDTMKYVAEIVKDYNLPDESKA